MGRRYYSKSTTDSMNTISISYLVKNKFLEPNKRILGVSLTWTSSYTKKVVSSIGFSVNTTESPSYLELKYTHNETEKLNYKVYLTTTTPNFGGVRWWFLCPNCNRRVAFLYGGKYFLCRHCHNLAYSTQHEVFAHRMLSKSRKIREQIEDKNGRINKPKGMHWKTFYKKLDEAERHERRGCMAMYSRIKRLK